MRVFVVKLLPSFSVQGFALKHLMIFEEAGAPKCLEISPDGSYAAAMSLELMDFWLINTAILAVIKKA